MRKSVQEPVDLNQVKLFTSDFEETEINYVNSNDLNPKTFLSSKDIKEERLRLSTSITSITPQMKFFIRNGQVLVAENNKLRETSASKSQYIFILPISVNQRLIADINFNLFLTNEVLPMRRIIVQNIYGKTVHLGSHRITAWMISNQGRYVCLLVLGIISDSFLIIDLANFIVVQKTLPIKNVKGIVWAGDDRYLAFFNSNQVAVFEMQLGDYQTLTLPETIKQIEFSQDKLYVLTVSLQLFVYRKAQWVQKETPNFFRRWLFPYQSNSLSRVQFYLLTKSRLNMGQDINQDSFVSFIKINDQILYIFVYQDGKIQKFTLSQIDGQVQTNFEQIQDNYYQQVIRNQYKQLQRKGVENKIVKDMKIQVIPSDDKSTKIQINVVRLHEVGSSNLFVHDQILYI